MDRTWFPDDDAEVVSAPRTRSGEVYGHSFKLAL
jgi:hypothetical protein